jgi:mono/diheme cytochrome c family protein
MPKLLDPATLSVRAALALGLFVLAELNARSAEPSGEQIYKSQCARCHGPSGEGTKKFKRRLEGDRSVDQLADVIQKTMPESKPGSLSMPEANVVAAYVHGAFYSKIARERNRPARIELSRLTVRQYRQAVADLVGSFRSQPALGKERGLKGEYFAGRRLFRSRDSAMQRIDSRIAFEFGTASPVADKGSPDEFSIRWTGSLLTDDTGEYEFVIRTEHAARLWVNDTRMPLIDAWVKSGNDTEYRATLYLVAGRIYPLRLEYTKAKQGVDDSKTNKKKKPAVKSSMTLLWKAPRRALEPIASHYLLPTPAPEVFVCSTPFPPDDRSLGWERGSTVSKEWDQAATDAAIEAAGYISARINELAGTRDDAGDRVKKVQEFCRTLAQRAFRKSLTKELSEAVDRQLAASKSVETGVKRVVLLVLKSPHFLYREVDGGTDGFDVAARLSLGLWDSLPDRDLLTEAAASRLSSREQVTKQAERLLADVRGRAKLREFLLTWLRADSGHELVKDAKLFPGFDGAVVSDLRTSLELFLDDVVWSEASEFRQLLLSDEVFLDSRLAKLYGVPPPPDGTFQKIKLDAGRRAGVLSHPYLMTSLSSSTESSPIHRGVFLARGILGVALRPPPEAVAPLAPSLHPDLTTRQRVILQTRPGTCMTCHGIINPLGFALEQFDAIGRYREKENGKPIDATGSYHTRAGKTIQVQGARQLAAFLATSPEAHAAFVEQMFHHLVQQPVRAYGANTLDELTRTFAANGFHVRKLAIEIATIAALKVREEGAKRQARAQSIH